MKSIDAPESPNTQGGEERTEDRITRALDELMRGDGVSLPADHPLAGISQAIVERSGIDFPEGAMLSALLAVGAAAGSSAIVDSGGRRLNGSLNALFVANGILGGTQVLEFPFAALRRFQESDILIGKDDEFSKRFARDAAVRFQRSVAQEKQVLAELHKELYFQTDQEREEYVARALETQAKLGTIPWDRGHQAALQLDAATKATAEARARCGNATRLLKPLSFVESVTPDAALKAGKFSMGASSTCLDPFGLDLGQLVNHREKSRMRVAGRALASFEGNSTIIDGKPSIAPWFSLISRPREENLKKYLLDSILVDSGMVHRTLVVDLISGRTIKRMDLTNRNGTEAFEAILGALYQNQSEGEVRCFQLKDEAIKLYEAFCEEVQVLISRVPELESWFEVWPKMVLKLSLLLHIGSSENPEADIAKERLEIAAQVLKRVGASGLGWMLGNGLLKTPEEIRFDEEVARLVSKVRMKQPMTRRDLVRCYAGTRMGDIEAYLLEAIRKGLVEENLGLLTAGES